MSELKPVLIENFEGLIWRMEIDAISQTLFAEIRHEGNREVSFASIDLQQGKVNFKRFIPEEKWLTGMEAGYNGVLILHNFQSPTSPAHKGIIAIDGADGNILWQNYNLGFDYLTQNGILAFDTRIQPKKEIIIDARTGRTLKPFDPLTDAELIHDILLPDMLPADQLPISLPHAPVGNIVHYLEYNNYRIVSLHAYAAENLVQKLLILDGDVVIFEDLLNTDIQKIQLEAFVLQANHLIYLKNKSTINVIMLNKD